MKKLKNELKETYTKIPKNAGIAITEASMREYMPVWWQNMSQKETGGLRPTDEGITFPQEKLIYLNMMYLFPKIFKKLTTQTIIWLDLPIDCPLLAWQIWNNLYRRKESSSIAF